MNIKLVVGVILILGNFTLGYSAEIPIPVKEAFSKKFPTAKEIQWHLEEPDKYEVNFEMDGKKISASFKKDGTWLEIETDLKRIDLPDFLKKILSIDFPSYELEFADRIENPNNVVTYELQLESDEENEEIVVIFSADGTIINRWVRR